MAAQICTVCNQQFTVQEDPEKPGEYIVKCGCK